MADSKSQVILYPHLPRYSSRHTNCTSAPKGSPAFPAHGQQLEENSGNDLGAECDSTAVPECNFRQPTAAAVAAQQEMGSSNGTLVMTAHQPPKHYFGIKCTPPALTQLQQEINSSTSSALVLIPNRPLNYARFIMKSAN